jgi:hypothetical protein
MRPSLLGPVSVSAADHGREDLERDLWLPTLYEACARGDGLIEEAVRKEMLAEPRGRETIVYRQRVLKDCLEHRDLARALYDHLGRALRAERQVEPRFSHLSPTALLDTARSTLVPLLDGIEGARGLLSGRSGELESEGFSALIRFLDEELGPSFMEAARELVRELAFDEGLGVGARLGTGCRGRDYRAVGGRLRGAGLRIALPEGDASRQAVEELRERGVQGTAEALSRARDGALCFLAETRRELAFYLGCANLVDALGALGLETCLPEPVESSGRALSAAGLYDPCLALELGGPVVANSLEADGRGLVIVTGANQGGKSTFLRSLGLAQLMTQCGMPAPASRFRAEVCAGIFTHFRKAEDRTMISGKLDEELARLALIVDRMRPGSLLLLNESFASTNEREGSEIGRRIVGALLEAGMRIVFVTHLYDFAASFQGSGPGVLYLRAEREADGRRSYAIAPGEPLDTSFGRDVYLEVFKEAEAHEGGGGARILARR